MCKDIQVLNELVGCPGIRSQSGINWFVITNECHMNVLLFIRIPKFPKTSQNERLCVEGTSYNQCFTQATSDDTKSKGTNN